MRSIIRHNAVNTCITIFSEFEKHNLAAKEFFILYDRFSVEHFHFFNGSTGFPLQWHAVCPDY